MKRVSAEIFAEIRRRGISNQQLATAYGTTPNYISQLAGGYREIDMPKMWAALHSFGMIRMEVDFQTEEILWEWA